MKTYQMTLPDGLAELVDRALAEKKWDSLDDLVADALGIELEGESDQQPGALRDAVRVGIEQADRGEVTDGEVVVGRLRAKLDAARKQTT